MRWQRDLPPCRRCTGQQANELGASADVKLAQTRADGGLAHASPGIGLTSPRPSSHLLTSARVPG